MSPNNKFFVDVRKKIGEKLCLSSVVGTLGQWNLKYDIESVLKLDYFHSFCN